MPNRPPSPRRRAPALFLGGLLLVALIAGGVVLWLRTQGPREYHFATLEELDAHQRSHQYDLWEDTFYCGDRDGVSWFAHLEMLKGRTTLTIPADQWIPPNRFLYTEDKRFWQGWYEARPELSRQEDRARARAPHGRGTPVQAPVD